MMYKKCCLTFVSLWLPMILWSAAPSCYYEIERDFYRPYFVAQAMAFQGTRIPQSIWLPITQELSRKAQRVPEIVRSMAREMRPNPFEALPYDPLVTSQLLTQVLMQVLADTLVEFNVSNPERVRQIFEYVKGQQINRWRGCFGEPEMQKPRQNK